MKQDPPVPPHSGALDVLTQRLPMMRLRPGHTLEYMPNLLLRGLKALPVAWGPA